jgi:tetratricopeptide (TPR) repeat protein
LAAASQTGNALAAYDQALRIWQARAVADPADVSPARALAGIYAELADLHAASGDTSRACADYQRSQEYLRQLPDPETGVGARYPWSPSTDEMQQRAAELCSNQPRPGQHTDPGERRAGGVHAG